MSRLEDNDVSCDTQGSLKVEHVQLGVLVSSVSLQVLSDGDGLLDQVVQVFGDGGVQTWNKAERVRRASSKEEILLTVGLQDSQDLVTSDELDLGDTVRVSQDDTDLRGAQTSSGKLEDLVTDFLRGGLGPRGLRPSVRKSGGGWWTGSSRGVDRDGQGEREGEGREHKVGCQ